MVPWSLVWLLAAAPQIPSASPVLDVGVHLLASDGDERGYASVGDAKKVDGFVSVGRGYCSTGASRTREWLDSRGDAAVIWHVSGHVLDEQGPNVATSAFKAQIDWERVFDTSSSGSSGTGKKGSTVVTLRLGERQTLDELIPGASTCDTARIEFSAQVVSRSLSGAFAGAGRRFTAELWLVHRFPDGSETTERPSMTVIEGSPFTFSTSVPGKSGQTSVEFVGTVRRGPARAAGTPQIIVRMERFTRSANPKMTSHGVADKTVSWPNFNEVVSFEFPDDENLLNGHQFSLRLRVRPSS